MISTGSSQVAGSTFSVTVTAKDAYGETATGYIGKIHFSSSDSGSGVNLPSDYAFQPGDLGIHTFTNGITLVTAGTQSITATDTTTSSITGSQTGITVNHAAAAAKVAISPAGSTVTAGMPKTYSATASDIYGNTWNVTSSTSWSITPGAGGTWSSNVYTSANVGSWNVTGTYASTAYITGLTVNPAGMDHFIINTVTTQTSGTAFNITVTAKDTYNNTVTNYVGSPSLTYSAGTIAPNTMNAFIGGVETTSVTVTTAGSGVTITATDGTHSGKSNLFTVNPTISASAGTNGAISPTGSVSVNYGSSQTFTITANTGFQIADVIADNVSLGAVSTYTFTDVQTAHTITANFTINTFNITASAGAGGSISPNGSVTVNYGGNKTFTITPNNGYYIVDVSVKGNSIGTISSYTFTNVQGSNTISATFAPTPTPSPSPTPSPKPTTTPTPTPTSSPTPTPSATTVPAMTGTGARVDLAISGNVTSSQISDALITSYQLTKITTLSFTIVGPKGTAGLGNMTIPKNAISYGTSPVVYIDGQMATNQGYTQDTYNFYVWYITSFGTNLVNSVSQVTVKFLVPSTSPATSIGPILAIGITVPEIISIFTVIAVRRLRRKPDNA
jgi:hypothetical protein